MKEHEDYPDPKCELFFDKKLRKINWFYITIIVMQMAFPVYLTKDKADVETIKTIVKNMILENNKTLIKEIQEAVTNAVKK